MTPEMLYNALLGLVVAVFWHWVRGIDKKQDEDKARMDRIDARLGSEIAEIRKDYQRRDDAEKDNKRVVDMLKDIKEQVDKISDKLDRKADK